MHDMPPGTAPRISPYDKKLFLLLITPSVFSGVACLLIGVAASIAASLQNSFFASWRAAGGVRLHLGSWTGAIGPSLRHKLDALVIFGVWFLAGIAVYYSIANIYKAIQRAHAFEHELQYVHANRQQLIRTAIVHLAVRLIAIGGWIGAVFLFFRVILPAAVALAHTAGTRELSASSIGLIAAASGAICLGLHLQLVLVRLLFLRVRLLNE